MSGGMGSGMAGGLSGMGGGMGGPGGRMGMMGGGMVGQMLADGDDGRLRSSNAVSAAELASREMNPQSKLILKRLDAPISMNFGQNNTLEEVLKYIKQATAIKNDQGIPIYVDPKGLKEAGASLQSPVELDLEGVPLKTTFRLILKQIGLAYCVRDGVLIVSSVQGIAEELMEAKSELEAVDSHDGAGSGIGGRGGSWRRLRRGNALNEMGLILCGPVHRPAGRRGIDHQTASKAARASSSRASSVAARVASSCSGRLAPTIAEVIPGCCSTQATLAVARFQPRRWQYSFKVATASNWAACQ